MPPSQTISPKLPMTNYFTFCYPYDNLFPPFRTWKDIGPMSPWQTIATMPSSENLSPIQPFHPFYRGKLLPPCHSWQTISHLPSPKTMGPIPPGQTISPILSMTHHLSETKKVFHQHLCVSAEEWHFPISAFLAMVRILLLSIRQSFALNLPRNNTTLNLVKSIWISTASGSIHVVVVWFRWLAICFLVCFQPLKELSLIWLIFPLKPKPWRERAVYANDVLHVAVTKWQMSCSLRYSSSYQSRFSFSLVLAFFL